MRVAPFSLNSRVFRHETRVAVRPVRRPDFLSLREHAEVAHEHPRRQGARRRPPGRARADRAPVRQGHRHAHGRRGRPGEGRGDPHGRAVAGHRARHRRLPARPHRRDLRPRVLGQDDADLPHHRRGPEARRRVRVHRRRARHGPAVRQEPRREHRRAARLPARLRRAGARDRRHAGALGGGRRRGGRLGGGAHPARRARGPDGRPDGRPPGADDVPGDAQAGRQPEPHQDRSACSPTRSARRSA